MSASCHPERKDEEVLTKPDAIFFSCILSQGLAKRGPNLFLEFHPKGYSGMLHMLTN